MNGWMDLGLSRKTREDKNVIWPTGQREGEAKRATARQSGNSFSVFFFSRLWIVPFGRNGKRGKEKKSICC